MPRYVRFLLFDNSSFVNHSRLGNDIMVDAFPHVEFGTVCKVSNYSKELEHCPAFIVANLSRIKREQNPEQPGQSNLIYEVYLARSEDWTANTVY